MRCSVLRPSFFCFLLFESTNSNAPHVKAGRARALAVSGARRSAAFPDLPTVAEAGVPGYEVRPPQ